VPHALMVVAVRLGELQFTVFANSTARATEPLPREPLKSKACGIRPLQMLC
jgi:hypothetical protein